jgi:hypothetical protein
MLSFSFTQEGGNCAKVIGHDAKSIFKRCSIGNEVATR